MNRSRHAASRRWHGLAVAGLTLAGSACSDQTSSGPPIPNQVSVQDDYFNPRDLTVALNSTVTFVWGGQNAHNVTYVAGPTPLPPNSKTVGLGIFMSTFTKAGTYDYLCTLHAGMVGKIIVTP